MLKYRSYSKTAASVRAKCLLASSSKLFIAFGVCAAAFSASAQSSSKGAWTKANILTDGAAVYEKPDFDSTVQDYIRINTSIWASKRPFAGLGGLGLFHKVSYNKKTGYMADTDIKMGAGGGGDEADSSSSAKADKPTKRKKKKKDPWNDDGSSKVKEPVFLTRYLGVALGMVNYTELYQGHKLTEGYMLYGVRWSGPNTLWLPLPLDFNFWFSFQPPKYLGTFKGGTASGYTIFGDVALQLPAVNLDDWMVTYGVGLVYVYADYKIPVKKAGSTTVVTFPSAEFRLGVDFGLGVATRIKKVLVRADLKYYIEKTSYLGGLGSVQMEF